MAAEAFSGAHPFRPQCAIKSIVDDWATCEHGIGDVTRYANNKVAEVVERIDAGRCPRCGDPLPDGHPEQPAGSRVTSCRCIPVCGRCGSDETIQPTLGRPMSRVWQWPVGKGAITRRRNRFDALYPARPATLTHGSDGGALLVSDDGVTPMDMTPNSGGWAQHGYDDSPDRQERSR